MTYDDCKKQVAEKHGFSKWRDCLAYVFDWDHDKFYAAVLELYAQAKANEAVKEDRARISERLDWDVIEEKGSVCDHLSYFNKNFPLPYPDEK